MLSESIVAGLAGTSFLWFAVIVGIIVSFDVSVLEFTRKYQNEGTESVDPERFYMRILHPLFHGGSFFIYTGAIAIFQIFSLKIPEIFNIDVPDNVIPAFMYFISVMVFIFVWMTYRNKIAEDNSGKTGAVEEIDRLDMRGLVSLVHYLANKIGAGDKALGAALAGAVAVDMLAISALIKDYVLPTNYEGTITEPIASLTGFIIVDIFAFSLIIAFVVFWFVVIAQGFGRWLRHDSRWIIIFRVLEPLMVFFIAMETVRSTIGYMHENIGSGNHQYSWSVDLLFSVAIVFSLIVASGHSPKKLLGIWTSDNFQIDLGDGVKAALDADVGEVSDLSITESGETIGKSFLYLIFMTLASLSVVFGSMWISYLTIDPSKPHNHLVESTAYFSAAFSLLVTCLMYIPSRRLDRFETNEDFNFVSDEDLGYWQLFGPILGALLGAGTVVSFGWIYMGRTFETDVIALWLAYLVAVWLFFQLRCVRFLRAGTVSGMPRRATDADFSELLSAFGVASSMVALIATLWASGLWIKIMQFVFG